MHYCNNKKMKAKEMISNISQQRQAHNEKELIYKLNVVVTSNEILNNLFKKLNSIKRSVGRPRKLRNPLENLATRFNFYLFFIVLTH